MSALFVDLLANSYQSRPHAHEVSAPTLQITPQGVPIREMLDIEHRARGF